MKLEIPCYPEVLDASGSRNGTRRKGEEAREGASGKKLTSFTSVIDRMQNLSSPFNSLGVRDNITDDYSASVADCIDCRLRCEVACQRMEGDLRDLILLLMLAIWNNKPR